jgi:hypothetical protein
VTANSRYKMTLSLNVLNHLGINLYSSVPAVISEVVANSWDADAEMVDISLDPDKKAIIITDDGHGMTEKDINEKFLLVGYRRREDAGGAITKRFRRRVMGRKGIGKLSLFSIARNIEAHTVKGGKKRGFRMLLRDIEKAIRNKGESGGEYRPPEVSESDIKISKGTKLIITDLKKKDLGQAEAALRKRLARRFGVIGETNRFLVKINGSAISIKDRDYFHKIQYLWWFGNKGKAYRDLCKNMEDGEKRSGIIKGTKYKVSGWIGTVDNSGKLKEGKENLNKIVIMARGKLVQEDILEDIGEGGVYSKYLIGEINAEFIDSDQEDDITTTSRQKLIEESTRYQILKGFVTGELKHIQSKWTDWRNLEGEKEARKIPAIDKWMKTLPSSARRKARGLFGKINQMQIDSDEERRALFTHGVLAFETLRYKDNLDALESISAENLAEFAKIIGDCDDIEAAMYHQIVRERIAVIEALIEKVESNALEQVVQEYLFDHLWLLDPSWERATESSYMEKRVEAEFKKLSANLSEEERKGRYDIKYTTTARKHVIIELKRANRAVSTGQLITQTPKYRQGLRKVLAEFDQRDEPIEIVCIVGRKLTDWKDAISTEESKKSLGGSSIRVVTYQQLILDAQRMYSSYLEKKSEVGRISKLLEDIDAGEMLGKPRKGRKNR